MLGNLIIYNSDHDPIFNPIQRKYQNSSNQIQRIDNKKEMTKKLYLIQAKINHFERVRLEASEFYEEIPALHKIQGRPPKMEESWYLNHSEANPRGMIVLIKHD